MVAVEQEPGSGRLLETTKLKVLEIMRRNWSQLVASTGREVIRITKTGGGSGYNCGDGLQGKRACKYGSFLFAY